MMEKVWKTIKVSKGSGGWIEDYEYKRIPFTKFTGKRTGKTIHMPEHKDVYSAKEIRKYILSNYGKDYARIFHPMKPIEIQEEFLY